MRKNHRFAMYTIIVLQQDSKRWSGVHLYAGPQATVLKEDFRITAAKSLL